MSRKRRMKRRLAGPQRPSHLGASRAEFGANFLSEIDAPYLNLGASLFPGAVSTIQQGIPANLGIESDVFEDFVDIDSGEEMAPIRRVDTSQSGFLSGFSTLHYAAMAVGAAALVYFITKK
jgi:hypothetical protein